MLLDGQAIRSCQVPVETAVRRLITTIEASERDPVGARVVAAWIAGHMPRSGDAQSGQVMAATPRTARVTA